MALEEEIFHLKISQTAKCDGENRSLHALLLGDRRVIAVF